MTAHQKKKAKTALICSMAVFLSALCCRVDAQTSFPATESPFAFFIADAQSALELGVRCVWEAQTLFPCDDRMSEIREVYDYLKGSGVNQIFEVVHLHPWTKGQPLEDRQRIELREFYHSMTQAVAYCDEVDYWVVGLEPDNWELWTPAQLAMYTRLAYRAVKNVNPAKYLVQGGSYGNTKGYIPPYIPKETNHWGRGFFVRVFELLHEFEMIEHDHSRYSWDSNVLDLTAEEFDVLFAPDVYETYLDGHHISNFNHYLNEYRIWDRSYVETIRRFLDERGYAHAFLWNTQAGLHTGTVVVDWAGEVPTYTETEQASFLIRKYISSKLYNVDRIFWTTIQEMVWTNNPEHYFSKVGLVFNGEGQDDLGAGVKKLGYYTYKKMVETLDGADWSSLRMVHDGTGSDYLYLFDISKGDRLVYVAWWDYFDDPNKDVATTKALIIDNLAGDTITVREAVPFALLGKDVADYATAFKSEELPVTHGVATVMLGPVPVYIEIERVTTPDPEGGFFGTVVIIR